MAATLAGFALLFAPGQQTARLESLVHDAALPGLRTLQRVETVTAKLPNRVDELLASLFAERFESNATAVEQSTSTQQTIRSLTEAIRRLEAQNASLRADLETAQAQSGSPFLAEPATPLFVPELLDAHIVAADDVSLAVQRASAQRVVDVGQTDGVIPADYVVAADHRDPQGPRVLIDQGDDTGLRPDQPVLAGRCVIGKVQQVGRWTSSLMTLTDPEFRGRAQLMRRTSSGLVAGPEGILAGDGDAACRLKFIPTTQPVAVGDEVYTALSGSPLSVPMCYGRVTAAHIESGAPYWEIIVQPAHSLEGVEKVQVLRVVLNPARTAPTAGEEGL